MSSGLTQLLNGLQMLPAHWPLVPTSHCKRPLGYQWQHNPLTPRQFQENLLQYGAVPIHDRQLKPYFIRPQGFGLLTGPNPEEFLIAVDVDGESAQAKLYELCGNQELPPTVAFSSGLPFRAQYLLKLAPNQVVRSQKIRTASSEILEIRGIGHQSVLPPSPHPVTSAYHWLSDSSPAETQVAPIPRRLLNFLNQTHPTPQLHRSPIHPRYQRVYPKATLLPAVPSHLNWVNTVLQAIHPRFADSYHDWIKIGLTLKAIHPDLLGAWDSWSQQSFKYKPGECTYKWKGFHPHSLTVGSLYWYAGRF
ncbi:bifunctional DNA primase/polymerase [Laspinema sp. D1]|uniref:Bifunctional DNA primase/polymerase n=1 Tax=Laspinema palackyanum D2a TaxID=2953684 RepID=A0ABT2N075_9CYAN|nr:bifunctional DNA primase/polymerase [Laspinema sp. D2a]